MTTPYRPIDLLPALTPATFTIRDIPNSYHPLVVSSDPSSPEAILSYKASKLEKQLAVDTKYDAIVERFCMPSDANLTTVLLVGVLITATIAALGIRR